MSDGIDGASPRELVLEASRRNNTELLEEVFKHLATLAKQRKVKETEVIAQVLNESRDGIGMGVLHLAALNGNYEVLDMLLDQEGLEIDEPDRMEQDTVLHKAVRFTNTLDPKEWEAGHQIVDILIDAGCDPRIRNKAKLKPLELIDPRNKDLRSVFQRAEYSMVVGDDVVQEDDDEGGSGSETD